MDRGKISTMFNKFLLGLLADEVAEADEIAEDLAADPPASELIEEPEDGWPNKYDEYMFGMTNEVIDAYGLDQESATELVLGTASALAEKKCLPALPKAGEEVSEEDLQKWVATAESVGLQRIVMTVADAVMREAVEAVAKEPDEDEVEE